MTEYDDSNKTIGILLGILVGAFFTYIILKRDQTQTLSLEQMQQQKMSRQQEQILQQQYQQCQLNNWQPMDIPKVDDIKPSIIQQDSKLVQIESQLQRATSQLDGATSQLDGTTSQLDRATSQLDGATSQLDRATSQLDGATSKIQDLQNTVSKLQDLQNTVSKLQQNNTVKKSQVLVQPQITQPQQDMQQHVSNTIYRNNEKWEIKRGLNGRISSLNIIRDVKKNG